MSEKTPLEAWIVRKIGCSERACLGDRLRDYQLERLNATLARVRDGSRFYQRKLGAGGAALSTLEELSRLPFTAPEDLRAAPNDFLCVRPDEVSRIVTLPTSGTTGAPKRIFFTEDDQELTRDFFHVGMSTLVVPGDRVLILLPGSLPGSVGSLLKEGLARMDVEGIVHGPVRDAAAALQAMEDERATALVGIPVQVLRLARLSARQGRARSVAPRSVLLSTDYLPRAIVQILEDIWGCEAYDHYGSTEMGLGGGVDCAARGGYHLREADLFFEIVDPDSGCPVAEGESGEVVFTTLTRSAMPLVRYRTGDISRFIPGSCPCGTVLRRMAHVEERLEAGVELGGGRRLRQRDFDEAVFPLDGVTDFRVEFLADADPRKIILRLAGLDEHWKPDSQAVRRVLATLAALGEEMHEGAMVVEVHPWSAADEHGRDVGASVVGNTGTSKRKIVRVESEPRQERPARSGSSRA